MALRYARSSSRALASRVQRSALFATLFAALALFAAAARLDADFARQLRVAALDAASPALSFFAASPLSGAGRGLEAAREATQLWSINAELRRENARLRGWYSEAARLEAENIALRDLLRLPPSSDPDFLAAEVVGAGASSFSHSLFVLAGHGQGVARDHIAVNGERLVGRVMEAGERVSRVLLLTDINSRVPVQVGEDRVPAILAGGRGSEPALAYLEREASVRDGDAVFTSGRAASSRRGCRSGLFRRARTARSSPSTAGRGATPF